MGVNKKSATEVDGEKPFADREPPCVVERVIDFHLSYICSQPVKS